MRPSLHISELKHEVCNVNRSLKLGQQLLNHLIDEMKTRLESQEIVKVQTRKALPAMFSCAQLHTSSGMMILTYIVR